MCPAISITVSVHSTNLALCAKKKYRDKNRANVRFLAGHFMGIHRLKGTQRHNICLLLFYVLATSKVTSGRVLICDSARSWRLYNAAPTRKPWPPAYLIQSHYSDAEPTGPCAILIMPSAWLGSE